MPDLAMKPPSISDDLFQQGVAKLVDLGVDPSVASGAMRYAWKNENLGGDPYAVNRSSGASFLMQWLGSRKRDIIAKYGESPSPQEQFDFMGEELQGPESLTLERLKRARGGGEAAGYEIWGRSYERPGSAALMKAGLDPLGGMRSGFSLPAAGLGAPPADFNEVRRNALAALGPQDGGASEAERPIINVNLGGSEAGEGIGTGSAWARLRMLGMIQQLSGAGTHRFEPIDYDPWKYTLPSQARRG